MTITDTTYVLRILRKDGGIILSSRGQLETQDQAYSVARELAKSPGVEAVMICQVRPLQPVTVGNTTYQDDRPVDIRTGRKQQGEGDL